MFRFKRSITNFKFNLNISRCVYLKLLKLKRETIVRQNRRFIFKYVRRILILKLSKQFKVTHLLM